ncbi:MAG: anhydro-N-acetylmuramyl-tripeptide amidase [Bifidobacterium catenulatum]
MRRVKTVERKNEMLSTKKTKTPDHYPCGHMRGPGWHDWRACLTKQGVEEDEWPV